MLNRQVPDGPGPETVTKSGIKPSQSILHRKSPKSIENLNPESGSESLSQKIRNLFLDTEDPTLSEFCYLIRHIDRAGRVQTRYCSGHEFSCIAHLATAVTELLRSVPRCHKISKQHLTGVCYPLSGPLNANKGLRSPLMMIFRRSPFTPG